MRRSSITAVCLVAGLATGCAALQQERADPYRLPPGSTIELMTTLELPGNASRVYIQGGKRVSRGDINKFKPNCVFVLDRSRDNQAFTSAIHPARFEVTRFELDVRAAADSVSPLRIAFNAARPPGGGGTPWPFTFYTRMTLHSADEPQVTSLTCQYEGHPWDRSLTVDQIRGTLGDIARID